MQHSTYVYDKISPRENNILAPGSLVKANISNRNLIILCREDEKSVSLYPDNWVSAMEIKKCFGDNPVALVLGTDMLENYYKIVIGCQIYWHPIHSTTEI